MRFGVYPRFVAFLILTGTSLLFSASSSASPIVLWQIGAFDTSSNEFSRSTAFWGSHQVGPSADATADEKPVFVVGKSDPAKDWPAVQPGTGNGPAGYRPHPILIEFDLPSQLRGAYSLKVAMLVESPGIPWLQAEINGHIGWFYRSPRLTYAPEAAPRSHVPILSSDTITFDIPTAFLKHGANQLILSAIDEHDDPYQTSDLPYSYGHSQIVYDALELTHDLDSALDPSEVTADVRPTIFYKSGTQGLTQQVDVYVRFAKPSRGGQVTLRVGDAKLVKTLVSDRHFGEELLEFDIPELSAPAESEVTISIKGRTHRFRNQLLAGKKWTLFVVPSAHLDIGYTDQRAKVAELHSRMLDQAIRIAGQQPDFRFSVDGYWIVEQFLRSRTEEAKKKLFDAVADNRIFVPAQYASATTGSAGLETLFRSLYRSYAFAMEKGGRFDYANITDEPSYSWSYASVLAAAGLQYFVGGANNYRGPIHYFGRLHEKSPFWWEGPDGGRVLMWYARTYAQLQEIFGFPGRVAIARESLPVFLQSYSHPGYKSDAVILNGTQEDNVGIYAATYSAVDAWRKNFAYPRIRYSGFSEALQYIAGQQGEAVPVVRGDGNPYWEDGLASDAHFWALTRESEQRVLSAEKLATASSLINPDIDMEPDRFNRIWEHLLLMNEHTWEAKGRPNEPESQQHIRQRAAKRAHATEAKRELEEVLLRSMSAITDYIPASGGTWSPRRGGTLVVFNPLNWKRNGLVEVDLNRNEEVVDSVTGQAVPFELLYSGNDFNHVRFLAQDVPGFGFKCFGRRVAPTQATRPEKDSAAVLENRYYRLVLDTERGAISHIFDKELNRELVDSSSPYGFGQYLYVTGGDELPNRLNVYSPLSPLPDLKVHGAQAGRLLNVTRSPFGTVARLESFGLNTPRIETEIVLFDAEKKIQLSFRVQKERVYTMEAVYFSFPFAMDRPVFRYALQNGFVDPERDQLAGAGKEWFTGQHWVAAEQNGVTGVIVPVDAPLFTLGDIVRGTWPTEFGRRPGWIFSYAMNNYWRTNFVASQGGDFTFRYVVSSRNSFDPVAFTRIGWEALTPFEVNEIHPFDKSVAVSKPLKEEETSFVKIDEPNIVLVTWKNAEDRKGTILRLLEVGGQTGRVRVSFPLLRVNSAFRTNAMEKNQEALEVSSDGFGFVVKPFEIVTVRVDGSRR